MKFEKIWQGKKIRAEAQWLNGQCWVHLGGKTFIFESESDKKKWRKRSGNQSASGDLVAPMPGKVTKVLFAVGNRVEKGDVVLVMEAMKMEYTLKASVAGEIQELNCHVGDQVGLGQILVKFSSELT